MQEWLNWSRLRPGESVYTGNRIIPMTIGTNPFSSATRALPPSRAHSFYGSNKHAHPDSPCSIPSPAYT